MEFGDFNGLEVLSLDSEQGVIKYLNLGQTQEIRRTFFKGNTYYIVAAADDSVTNIDINLFDDKMNLLTEDNYEKPDATIEFVPEWTGLYHIKVILRSGNEDGANIGWLSLYSEN